MNKNISEWLPRIVIGGGVPNYSAPFGKIWAHGVKLVA